MAIVLLVIIELIFIGVLELLSYMSGHVPCPGDQLSITILGALVWHNINAYIRQ